MVAIDTANTKETLHLLSIGQLINQMCGNKSRGNTFVILDLWLWVLYTRAVST